MFKDIRRVAQKEWASLFSSPIALVFLGAFLSVTLFTFFWVETFFSRNIADVRPLFEWMPVLLIFLMGAVTMRMWSEERRMGTLEYLMTLPVETSRLVLGKFLACWILALAALALTLPLPLSVSLMGPLDMGPVVAGYLAAAFLAAAYASIGLYVSSKTDSQIVSLLVSTFVGGAFYVLGSDVLTGFVGNKAAEILRLFGTGARFESITRGVLDIRDLYYYVSLTSLFLALNIHALESLRWSREKPSPRHTRALALTVLLGANFVAANLWLRSVRFLRLDMTQGRAYSISSSTKSTLAQLREPLLIRGYFSKKTHPLLAPLVPQLRDMILEYQTAAPGRIRCEFVDPMEHPELEKEAGEKYGIKAVPFQVADRYQAGLVNSYFNILVSYGDKFEVLGFESLIEVKQGSETKIDVQLRNPEYDITRTIKKVLESYQGDGDLFATIQKPVVFTGWISPDEDLPKSLVDFRASLASVLVDVQKEAGGKLTISYKNPREGEGTLAREIAKNFGIQPLRMSLFDTRTFYFQLMMQSGAKTVLIPLPSDLSPVTLRQSLDAGLKRFSVGFLKTIALTVPPPQPRFVPNGPSRMEPEKHFDLLKDKLTQNHGVFPVDLKEGTVPEETDLLLVAAPKQIDEKQLFAIDQFLMKGGTLVLLASSFEIQPNPLSASPQNTGLKDWLDFNGLHLKETMVLDPQNTAFPVPVERRVGPFVFQEIRLINYPYFVDVRDTGLTDKTITPGLSQVTLNWASPLEVDKEKNKARKVTEILKSSPKSWASASREISPKLDSRNGVSFPAGEVQGSQLLAVAVEGEFVSFFKDKKSPLTPTDSKKEEKAPLFQGVIEKSAPSARIVLVGSQDFLTDEILSFTSSAGRTAYTHSLQLVENIVDWSLEDRGLLAIRGRGHFARLLKPMTLGTRMFWEYLNDGLALVGLMGLWGWVRARRRRHVAEIPELISNHAGRS